MSEQQIRAELIHAVRYALNGIDGDGTNWQDVRKVLTAALAKAEHPKEEPEPYTTMDALARGAM